jgi:preprotein translocase subunit SecD
MGMAVDANVLIFERIREEVRAGRTPLSAVDAGYQRALTTIIDANLTTLFAAIILFMFGTGPIQGFAVTLSIGLMTSMFTAIMLTRLMVVTWLRRRRAQALPI